MSSEQLSRPHPGYLDEKNFHTDPVEQFRAWLSEAIAAGIHEAIARRDELAPRGPARARNFTWQASAEATAAVYRELA